MRGYSSILDEIAELFEKQGHSYKKASFVDDRVDFGVGLPPPKQFTSSKSKQEKANSPVAGRQGEDGGPTNVKKQLQLKPSSNIQSAAYWEGKQYLLVSFKSGATYSYEEVPLLTVQLWQAASSAGQFHYYNIRMNYPYKKMG